MSESRTEWVEETNEFDVVISGDGPVALAAALEAIKLGKKVAIIKNYFFSWPTNFLDKQSRFYLLGMFPSNHETNEDDKKFFERLTTDITIRVRDIER
ncbi:MAG: hypothetical protein KF702_01665 [Gammaproteobacteria bacterium]|nr:hypothetical protein [Gammaproteobacteria bacterium]